MGFTQALWIELKWTEEIYTGVKEVHALRNSNLKITNGIYPTERTAHISKDLCIRLFTVVYREIIGNKLLLIPTIEPRDYKKNTIWQRSSGYISAEQYIYIISSARMDRT